MSRRKPHTKRFNQRYGKRIRADKQQQANEAVLRASPAAQAKPKAASSAAASAK
jgi:hypothetical protein